MAQQFFRVGPQSRMDVDVPWRDETLQAIDAVAADLELRMLMGARLQALAARLRSAPSRPRPKLERVTLAQIRPVEFPGASPGWYLDQTTGREVVFEDVVNRGWWRETPFPRDAFTLGELVVLESELWAAGDRFAAARENLSQAQRALAVELVEAADGLQMRIALMQWQPDSPEEEEAMKRSMLEALAKGSEDNPAKPDHLVVEGTPEHLSRETYEGRAGEDRHITANEEGHVDPRRLLGLPGARGEHDLFARSPTGAKTQEQWDELVRSIREEGVRDAVFVVVEPRTRQCHRLTIHAGPQIHEGNHRVRAAVAAGVRTIPIQIRYFGKAEDRWTVAPEVPRSPVENPAGAPCEGSCEILAAHEYVSPRQRELTAEEHGIREVAWALKRRRRWALTEAALEMAMLVTPDDVLVPIPDSTGSTTTNRRLARRISKRSGAPMCDALTRRLAVPSSRGLRAAGLPPLTVAAHEMLRMHGCPRGRVLFVDNVATTGGTGAAAASALGVPCALLVWAWHRTHAELDREDNPKDHAKGCDPGLVVKGPASAKRAMAHPAVVKQHERTLRRRRKHKVAVLVPCASQKPYRNSPSHRLTYCPALAGKKVDVWVVSEPMGVFPYEWSDEFPNDAYEFHPKHVKGEVREQLVERIHHWMEKQGPKYDRVYLALPKHHMDLVCDASAGVAGLNLYDASIAACKEVGACPPNYDQVTTHAYRDYLRNSIR